VSSVGFVGGWRLWFLLLKCVERYTGWTVFKWIVESHDQYHHVSSALVALVTIACWQRRPLEVFAEFVFLDLSPLGCVCRE
jgi:hypothetical protein